MFITVLFWHYFGYIFDLEQEVDSFAQEVCSPDNQIAENHWRNFGASKAALFKTVFLGVV